MRRLKILAALFVVLGVSGCSDLSKPTNVTASRMQLVRDVRTETLEQGHFDEALLNNVAQDFRRRGDGFIRIAFVHDGGKRSAASASKLADRYETFLKDKGITRLDISLRPAEEGEDPQIKLQYAFFIAAAADGCGRMPGATGGVSASTFGDYRLGCETQHLLSRSIANPADLMGRDTLDPSGARRQGGVVEPNQAGEPNEPLQGGFDASELGQGGG